MITGPPSSFRHPTVTPENETLAATRPRVTLRSEIRPNGHELLLEQPGEPPIGEDLAARLTGGAVLQGAVREGHLADRVAAHRAGLAATAVHPHAGALGVLE